MATVTVSNPVVAKFPKEINDASNHGGGSIDYSRLTSYYPAQLDINGAIPLCAIPVSELMSYLLYSLIGTGRKT